MGDNKKIEIYVDIIFPKLFYKSQYCFLDITLY